MIVSGGTRYLAVIPARGGSKRVPRKNFRDVAGRPLVGWTIEHVRASQAPMRVVVSTDDAEIRDYCLSEGVEVPVLRPSGLADDETPMEPVIEHVLATLHDPEEITHVVLLPPTSPVRDDHSIDAAIELYERSDADSLVSVSEVSPLLWGGSAEAPVPLYDLATRPRLQSVPEPMRRYVENGSIVVTSIASLRATGLRIGGRGSVMFVMGAHEGIDIDDEYDLWLASEWIAHAARRSER